MPDEKEVSYGDVRRWIIEHSDDKATMDDLNKLTYVFTSKYDGRVQGPQ